MINKTITMLTLFKADSVTARTNKKIVLIDNTIKLLAAKTNISAKRFKNELRRSASL